MLGEELLSGTVEREPVLGLYEAVALVGEQHVGVLEALVLHGGDDLLRLCLLDAGVVGALPDEDRDADVVDARERGPRPEEVAIVLWVAEQPVEDLADPDSTAAWSRAA